MQITNATKAQIIATLNATLGLVAALGVALTAEQMGAIGLFANAVLGLWVAVTYKDSPSRIPGGTLVTGERVELMGTPQKPVVVDGKLHE